jgi:hypothetical protein
LLIQNVDGQGVRLAVSAAYLEEFQRNGRVENLLFLDVIFPEMTPRQPIRRTVQEMVGDISQALNDGKTPDQVNPEYKHREGTWFGGVRLSGSTSGLVADALAYEISRHEPYDDESEPGFRHYRRDVGNSATAEDLLVPVEQPAQSLIWFACHPGSSCTAQTLIGDRIHMTYNMGRANIGQWRALDNKVRSWVRALVIDCFEGPKLEPRDTPAETYPCPF